MAKEPQDMLDIIFETRNKEYGAYFIRRNYDKFLRNALGIGLALICLLFAFPYIINAVSGLLPKPKVDVVIDMAAPPDIDANKPPPPPPPKVETPPPPVKATIRFVPPIVKKDEEVKEEAPPPPPVDVTVEVAKVTKEGQGDQNVIVANEPPEDLGKVEAVKVEKPEEPLTFVEAMPSFPGGEAEMLKYLYANIKYPAIAKESGISGRVALSFVVEKSGKITDIKIVKDIGGGCGKEAVRVVESMPPWKPGNQNGNPVRVRMTLPVTFKLE